MKITGLDNLVRQLDDAQANIKELDSELGIVSFDPHDPGSIEAAIKRVEALIDERVGNSVSNPIIAPLVDGLKEQYRSAILSRAAAARLKGTDDDVES